MEKFKVYSLAEATEEKRKEIEEKLASPQFAGFFRPTAEFGENGLRFPIEYLNAIGGAIVLLPLERTAEYVDIVTKTAVDEKDKEFSKEIFSDIARGVDFNTMNATALGNLAYVALNDQDMLARTAAFQYLQKYADWYYDELMKYYADQSKGNAVN